MSRKDFVSAKRDRVSGSGPKRQTLPSFHFIDTLSNDIIEDVKSIYKNHINENDIYGEDYNVSKYCDLRKLIPAEHKNLLLQKPTKDSDGMNQKDYTLWDKVDDLSPLKKFLVSNFKNSYRTRIAMLAPKSQIDWHIDMNTTVSCRFHMLIENDEFTFQIKRKNDIVEVPFKEGAIFFTNTAYPHRVYNPTERPRLSVLFDIDYKDVSSILPQLT